MGDEFPQSVKNELGGRVGWICSNPDCLQPTSGPSETAKAVTNVGVAAHITAASPGGARFDPSLTVEQRRSADNGIWLCARCAKFVDDDAATYPRLRLEDWKTKAEIGARRAIERGPTSHQPKQVTAAVYLGSNAVSITGNQAVILGSNAITINGPILSSQPSLSREAEQLLLEASNDPQGSFFVVHMLSGLLIQANKRDFVDPGNARSEARWRAVVRELLRSGLIEQTDSKEEVFALTDRGYEMAETLRA